MSITKNLFIPGNVGRISVRTKCSEVSPKKAIILVQGSNITGQAMFDFSAPSLNDYSLLDVLCGRGLMAVTFAIRGYGQSDAPEDPFTVTTEAGMEDLASVVEWVEQQGYKRPHLLGFSWGGRIAGRYVEDNPDRIDRLVLYDAARGGNLVPPVPTDPWWTNLPEHYSQKLEAEFTDSQFLQAFGEYVSLHESRSPNGIRLENARPFPSVNPNKITRPTQMIYGIESAKAAYMQGGISRADFFEQLATDDKSFVLIPEGGDFAHFQKARHRLAKEICNFLFAT